METFTTVADDHMIMPVGMGDKIYCSYWLRSNYPSDLKSSNLKFSNFLLLFLSCAPISHTLFHTESTLTVVG